MTAGARTEWQDDARRPGESLDTFEEKVEETTEKGERASRAVQTRAEKLWKELADAVGRVKARIDEH